MNIVKVFPSRSAFQIMPIIAMAMVVMLLGALLWVLHRNEVEDEGYTLIKDILWVEQNLHFHLTSAEEKLEYLADQMPGRDGLQSFDAQAHVLLAGNQELQRILLRDAEGRLVAAVPPTDETDDPAQWMPTFQMARGLGRASWTPALASGGHGAVLQVHVPIFRGRQFAGMVVGVVAIDALLTHDVPWWVAQKYRIEIVDGNGATLAAKTAVAPAEPGPSHQVRLEPPGHDIAVVATIYRSGTNLARNLLAASIFALAVVAISSLWGLRRHMRRRLQAEMALRQEHTFRKAMEDSLTVGMRARDLEGRITYVNPAFCRMVGWSEEELVGIGPPMPYWLPEELDHTMEMHRRVLAGAAPADGFEMQFRRKNGERFWALVYEAPLIDAGGRHSGWMASVLDITERKRTEEMARLQQEKLQRTARLITMGEMASTLAHELNQPLSAIASYTTGCLNRLGSGAYTREELEQALSKLGLQAQRAGTIIRRVHDFVRKSEPKLQVCDINEVLRDTMGFVEADARKRGVSLSLHPAPADPRVRADRILIEQVLLNLARNGIDAMAGTPAQERRLDVSIACREGAVVVAVADRGHGVDPDIAANLFQPFFTTKDEGMGMGLNICRSIIEFHQGRLWFEPNPGGGSVFQFSLPLEEGA
ncbi:MAG: sensor histidine kinase [Solirubrobacterales bacterium]